MIGSFRIIHRLLPATLFSEVHIMAHGGGDAEIAGAQMLKGAGVLANFAFRARENEIPVDGGF
jgi:hypothetical protein